MTTPSPGYTIVIAQELGTAVVSVRGELDDKGLARLEAILADMIDFQADQTVTVDARAMSLADPLGATVFRRAMDWAGQRGGTFRVVAPSASLCRALQMCGLANIVDIGAGRGHPVGDDLRSSKTRVPRAVPDHPSFLGRTTRSECRSPHGGHQGSR